MRLKLLFYLLIATVLVSCDKSDPDSVQIQGIQGSSVSVPNDNNPITFTVVSNVQWVATQSNPSSGFIISPMQGIAGETTVTLKASPNKKENEIVSTVVFTAGTAVQEVTFKQESLVFNMTPDKLTFAYNESKAKQLEIKSNTTWELVKQELPEWISATPTQGNGNGNISLTVTENKERNERKQIIKVSYAGVFASVLLTQDAAPNNAPSKPVITYPDDGDEYVSTTPTIKWTASEDADNDEITYKVAYSTDGSKWTELDNGTNTECNIASFQKLLEVGTEYHLKVIANDGYKGGITESETIKFKVGVKDSYKDGDFRVYMQSSKPYPVKLVFTGDGYKPEHFKYGGLFDQNVDEAIEALFALEPYKTYREYFTVYKVAAHSKDSGLSNKAENDYRNTAFSTIMEGGGSTLMDCNLDKVMSYALKIDGYNESDLTKSSICVIVNANTYAGTCYSYTDGKSVALVPVSRRNTSQTTQFGNIVCHEFGGHGFGRLADEYVNYDTKIPDNEASSLRTQQSYGRCLNVSLTSDPKEVYWKDFIGLPDYSHVSVFGGGNYYLQGVWRSEESSCMIDNRAYYNTISRYLIVSRIMSVAKEQFSLADFIAKDAVKSDNTNSNTTKAANNFVPLARPVIIKVD